MALLGGILTGILGSDQTATTALTGKGGILPTLPSLSIPTLPTLGLPTLTPPTPSAPSASAPSASAPSASAPPSSASLPSSSPSSSVLSTSVSSATSISAAPSSASAASTPPPDLSTGTGLSTGADGAVQTMSRVFTVTSDPSQTAAPAVRTKSFLENKPLSGTIFALIGMLGLVLIFGIATFAMRRRRRRRLLDDAVSFDPSLLAAATERYDGSEKGYSSAASVRTMGSGPASGYPSSYYGATQNQNPSSYYGATQNPSPYYGANQNPTAQQPYYSAYVPPMADTSAPSSLAGTRAPPHTIPRVPVPQQPLPAEFGSSDGRLKVVNE